MMPVTAATHQRPMQVSNVPTTTAKQQMTATASALVAEYSVTAQTSANDSKIIKQQDTLRYLPVAIMPTKHNSNNNNNNTNLTNGGSILQSRPSSAFAKPMQPTLAIISPGVTLTNGVNVVTTTTSSSSIPITPQPPMLIRTSSLVATAAKPSPPNTTRTIKSTVRARTPTTSATTPAPALIALGHGTSANVVVTTAGGDAVRPTGLALVGGNITAAVNVPANAAAVLTNGACKPARISTNGNTAVLNKAAIQRLVKTGQLNTKAKTLMTATSTIATSTLAAPPLTKIGQPVVVTSSSSNNTNAAQLQKRQQQQLQKKLEKQGHNNKAMLIKSTKTAPMKTTIAEANTSSSTTTTTMTLPIETKLMRNTKIMPALQNVTKPDMVQQPILVAKQIAANGPSTGGNILLTLTMPNVSNSQLNGNGGSNTIAAMSPSECISRSAPLRSKSLSNGSAQPEHERRNSSTSQLTKPNNVPKPKEKVIETITINDDDDENEVRNAFVEWCTVANDVGDDDADDEGSRDKIEQMAAVSIAKLDVSSGKLGKSKNRTQSYGTSLSIVKAETLQLSKEDFVKSLQCDEEIRNISSSTPSSNNSLSAAESPTTVNNDSKNISPTTSRITLAPFARIGNDVTVVCAPRPSVNSRSLLVAPVTMVKTSTAAATMQPTNIDFIAECFDTNKLNANILNSTSYADMFSMLSTFNMLSWRERQGYAIDSKLKYELNDFNILQLRERCEKRQGPATHYERPLFERTVRRTENGVDPLLYLCKRCNCHGPASEFLSPKFCSISCLRRTSMKRKQSLPPTASNATDAKQRRTNPSTSPARKPFRWSEYLSNKSQGIAAPIHLFLNPFPVGPNCFQRGMKLEAIDPENCSLFCVCTVVDVHGYRLKLTFDGYPSMYDFWVNADSMDIFPPGWCQKTNRVLQPPNSVDSRRFLWSRYLAKTKSIAAPRELFTHLNTSATPVVNRFQIGMHLEAEDLNDTGKICVATVADVLDERIRVHFDGWNYCYDFWVHVSSPYIHPCGWHEGRQQLIVPPDYNRTVFKWPEYIKEKGGMGAPPELFNPREPMDFKPDMKLEVVDQRNACLIRPATVVTRKGYRIQLHLDCWPAEYYFWLEDDSPDLHPIGWCEATVHELEAPPGYQIRRAEMPCDIEGCRGYGNIKRASLNVHALRDCCPYAPENWRRKIVKTPRIPLKQTLSEPAPPNTISTALAILPPPPNNETMFTLKQKNQRRNIIMQQVATNAVITELKKEIDLPSPSTQLEKLLQKPELKRKTSSSVSISGNTEEDYSSYMAVDPAQHVAVSISPEPAPVSTPIPTPSPSPGLDPRCIEISKPFVAEYGTRFVRNYNLWQVNSGFNMDTIRSNPLYWTTWDVYEFIERTVNSSQIAKVIFDEEIDGRALLMMNQDDFTDYLDIKLGPAIKLFSTIVQLRMAVICKFNTTETGLNVLHSIEKFNREIARTSRAQVNNQMSRSNASRRKRK